MKGWREVTPRTNSEFERGKDDLTPVERELLRAAMEAELEDMAHMRTMRHRLLVVFAVACAVVVVMIAAAVLVGSTRASDDLSWPCRIEGWEPGDHWGPGPLDVVPDVPLCEGEVAEPLVVILPSLPPTDTAP